MLAVNGSWHLPAKSKSIPDPYNGEKFVQVPDPQVGPSTTSKYPCKSILCVTAADVCFDTVLNSVFQHAHSYTACRPMKLVSL